MRHMYVMIRQDESHTEISYEREIVNYEECYRFKYREGTVDIWDCAALPVDDVRVIANEYAHVEQLGAFVAWDYGDE
jgi:hypothetical protein